WGNYYSILWRLAFLNHHYSHISREDWCIAGETTNIAESAHADAT
ncbi:25976_t:CDS:1, partial [Gigaspora rosea]